MLAERVKTWTEEWKQQGLDQGRLEGRLEGRLKGRLEGEAKVVSRLLMRRFGPLPAWVDQRLEQATEAELDAWTERLLDGQTLEAVFNDMN